MSAKPQVRPSALHPKLRVLVGALLLTVLLIALLFVPQSAQAQSFNELFSFGGISGAEPLAGLIRDSNNNLYGTTVGGGSFNFGTVFKLDSHGTETVLHSFWGGDGLGPAGSLIQDREGNLYGTTNEGGTPERGGCRHGCGAVFKLDATGKNKVLYAFTGGGDGGHPEANLIRDAEGNLYGTTADGGDLACDANGYYPGCGVVFRVNKDGNQTVLHAFSGSRDGAYPNGGLIRDKAENLYGVTSQGGALGSGMIFKLNRTGKETALYAFSGATDGGGPNGPLLRDAAGNLYGTTGSGGDPSCNCGVAFKLDTSGHETILYTFTTLDVGHPVGGLIRDPSGNYYGATSANWNCECGTVFELNTSGQLSVLFSFFGQQDGSNPTGNLVIDGAGDLFGTATYDGDRCPEDNYPCGIAFEITP